MRKWVIPLLLGLGFVVAQACIPSGPNVSGAIPQLNRYVFIVDTSGSMQGLGDGQGRKVFPKVQAEIQNFLNRAQPGSEVWIQTFDQGPRTLRQFRLPEGLTEVRSYIQNLQATGQQTYVYATLLDVLRRLPQSPSVATSIYLFTDGRDNDPSNLSMANVVKEYGLRRGGFDWLYYITLGIATPADVVAALRNVKGARALSAAPNQVPQLSEATLKPEALDLGNLFTEPNPTRQVVLQTQGKSSPIQIEVSAPVLEKAGGFLQVNPTRLSAPTQDLQFEVGNLAALPYGTYQATLCLRGDANTVLRPAAIAVRFSYRPLGSYNLKPLDNAANLTLSRGQEATLRFRVEGDRFATEPVELSLADWPQGLEGLLNGEPGPLKAMPGQEVALQIKNTGLPAGTPVTPSLAMAVPTGANGATSLTLPSVNQPLSLWEQLLRWWWLWLPLILAIIAFILFLARANAPWGHVKFSGPPPDCAVHTKPLKGSPVDLGQLFGENDLKNLQIKRGNNNKPVLVRIPPHCRLKQSGQNLECAYPIDHGDEVKIQDDRGKEIGSLEFSKQRR